MDCQKQGQKSNNRDYRIFVGGLTPRTTNNMLMEYFAKFGDILSAEVVYDTR